MARIERNQIAAENIVSFTMGPDFSLAFYANSYAVIVLGILAVAVILIPFLFRKGIWGKAKSLEIDEVQLGLGNGSIILHPNETDKQIAFAIWVELSTRKIGLQIDPEHDVIEEIYISWYAFFGIVRDLIKDIPVSKLEREDTKKIIELSISVLNIGLRPHLTEWQAKFRRWYKKECANDTDSSPQEIQQRFKEYDALVSDMMKVNQNLMNFRKKMKEIIT